MNTHPKGYAERLLLFHKAAQEVLRANPGLPLPATCTADECIDFVASLLAQGDCGLAVFWGGRELARHLLPFIERAEQYDTCAALQSAITHGTSLLDGEGVYGGEFKTPACLDWLAGEAGAGEPGVVLEPLPSVERICRIMELAYEEHSQSLPTALFTPLYASWRLGSRQAPTFGEFASQLHYGLAGGLVFQLGREFCRHVLVRLEAIGAYDLCTVLRQAVEHGESSWDAIGYLSQHSPETNLPDCNGSHAYLKAF